MKTGYKASLKFIARFLELIIAGLMGGIFSQIWNKINAVCFSIFVVIAILIIIFIEIKLNT